MISNKNQVNRPDNSDEFLGLTVLDEPNSKTQSDPTLLSLKLKAISKDIKMIDESETMVKTATSMRDIDSWVENIRQLHETTASTSNSITLLHSHRLPDVEHLMQEWTEEFESALNIHSLPSADLECSLEEYVAIICSNYSFNCRTKNYVFIHFDSSVGYSGPLIKDRFSSPTLQFI